MTTSPIRVLIVDDEPPARRKIRRFLSTDKEISIAGEASSGEEAVQAIRDLTPDVVFLDVQMGELDGFAVLEALDPELAPEIVFVTAHEEYALKAFDFAAIDYLLKPFDAGRFAAALRRVKERVRIHSSDIPKKLDRLLTHLGRKSRGARRILVKKGDRGVLLRISEISWIQPAGNYVELHAGGSSYLLRETLDGISRQLDEEDFLRVHRSYVVNAAHIVEIRPCSHGDHEISLLDETKIRLSRRFRDRLPELIRRHL